jgi:hypothetical protein
MRYWLRILAVCLIGMGVVWILQGINVLPGSFMTGHIEWAWRGGISTAAGLALFVFAGKPKRKSN